jgi:hypothetical protein
MNIQLGDTVTWKPSYRPENAGWDEGVVNSLIYPDNAAIVGVYDEETGDVREEYVFVRALLRVLP